MERFDEVVQDIKGAWLATHKTVKGVEYIYEFYHVDSNKSDLELSWYEKNPERIAKQIGDLVVEMVKKGYSVFLETVDYLADQKDYGECYLIIATITYTERFDD